MDRVNDEPRDPPFRGLDEPAIHGATCTIAVEPTRPIEGFVRDAVTNEPIPGAVVTAAVLSGSTALDRRLDLDRDRRAGPLPPDRAAQGTREGAQAGGVPAARSAVLHHQGGSRRPPGRDSSR